MRNEILLILSVVIIYGSVLLWYKLLGWNRPLEISYLLQRSW